MYLFRAVAITVGLLLAGSVSHVSAQVPGVGKGVGKGAKARPFLPQNKAKQKNKAVKQARQAAVLERFLQMSPQARARALQHLDPQRRRQILQRLNTIELLSDDERRTLRGRFDQFSGMRLERREAVRTELRQLRGLTPQERRNRLASPELREQFSDDEIQLLDEVAGQPE
jgi:hypothetical protein